MIVDKINQEISQIVLSPTFQAWKTKENVTPNDKVVLNNSFIYREVSTKKSLKYLSFDFDANGNLNGIWILEGIEKNDSDFKKFSPQLIASKGYTLTPLQDQVTQELSKLGKLIFILIGKIDDSLTFEEDLSGVSCINKVILNPNEQIYNITNGILSLPDTVDEDAIWQFVCSNFTNDATFESEKDKLREVLGKALDDIEKQAYCKLEFPDKNNIGPDTIIDSLLQVLDEQIVEYKAALASCNGDARNDKTSFNEILRISYNFSTDATNFIKLIVSVCDLKPLVLWGTVGKQFSLSDAFKDLPWTRAKNKPSLKNYIDMIGNARNSTFHKFFPFRRTMDMKLPDDTFAEFNLRIFSEFTNKKNNKLNYTDKDLVEVLTEFTRTNEHRLSPSFWHKNVIVMEKTVEVFKQTGEFLKLVYPMI